MTIPAAGSQPCATDGLVVDQHSVGFHSVVAPAAGRLLITNDLGRLILDRCDGQHTVEDLVTEIGGRFPAQPAEQVRVDVVDFLQNARDRGAVRW
jgi:Coenzyme PQQ synthesis protein D (PqqD)